MAPSAKDEEWTMSNAIGAIALLDEECDRCGEPNSAIYPFKLSETITFRRKVIEKAWLCRRCLVIEKRKWWQKHPNGTEPAPAAGSGRAQ